MNVLHMESCCAVDQFFGIQHQRDPEATLRDLCDSVDQDTDDWYFDYTARGMRRKDSPLKFASHYIFIGVVGYTKGRGKPPTYCQDLKAYIKKHHLGEVVESTARINRRHHPEHQVKAYIYTPHSGNLKKWWKKHGGD